MHDGLLAISNKEDAIRISLTNYYPGALGGFYNEKCVHINSKQFFKNRHKSITKFPYSRIHLHGSNFLYVTYLS